MRLYIMAILDSNKFNFPVFWDDEYTQLDYVREPFNDPVSVNHWITQGYQSKITGDLCDMRHRLPSWNNKFIDHFATLGWKDIGTAYYRMHTGTVMPAHSDLYKKYIKLFNLEGKEQSIYRGLIMLEDWKSGHYLEIDGVSQIPWKAGQGFIWRYDTPHMAANIGIEPRYTLQITGHT